MKLHAVSSYLVSFDVQTAQPATENDFPPSPDTAGEPVDEDPRPAPEADIESLKRQYELDLAEALEKQHEMHMSDQGLIDLAAERGPSATEAASPGE